MATNGDSPKPLADWTIMVYLAGDNNLTAECIYALTEMKKADFDNRINVIAQFDPQDDFLPTRRFRISIPSGTLLNDDIGGAPFKKESQGAIRRRAAVAAATKAAQQTAKDAAEQALAKNGARAPHAFLSARAKQQVGKNIAFELFDSGAFIPATETDTGSPVALYNFMSRCIEEFPAEHYMVVLSGHGAGTEQDFLLKDESPRDSLTISELRIAFEDLQQEFDGEQVIDILGMDTCLMSMAEVCYELKGLVDIIVSCESYSPASGWPYREILNRLMREPKQGEKPLPERVAAGIVEEYVKFYADYWLGGVSVDQSALAVSQVGDLKTHTESLADALIKVLEVPATASQFIPTLILAHWDAQSYNGELFVDLADFCDCLRQRCLANPASLPQDSPIPGLCETLANFIRDPFVLSSCYSGPDYQYSYGVSIYFPWARVAPSYAKLKFGGDSHWAEFLKTYTEQTRRPARNPDPKLGVPASGAFFNPQQFRMTEGRGLSNPVHSMRNPPLVWTPETTIDPQEDIRTGLKRLAKEGKGLPSAADTASSTDEDVTNGEGLQSPPKKKTLSKLSRKR